MAIGYLLILVVFGSHVELLTEEWPMLRCMCQIGAICGSFQGSDSSCSTQVLNMASQCIATIRGGEIADSRMQIMLLPCSNTRMELVPKLRCLKQQLEQYIYI